VIAKVEYDHSSPFQSLRDLITQFHFSSSLIKAKILCRARNIQIGRIHIQTISVIRPIRTLHIDTRRHNIVAHPRTRASKGTDLRLILFACRAGEVLEYDISDREWRREFETQGEIGLSIALVDLDGVVDVVNEHCVVGHVCDSARATASLEISAECGWRVGPDFYTCTILFVVSERCKRWMAIRTVVLCIEAL
jgi:hypothetical protein